MRGWTKTIVDTVAIVLIILAAKTAIAEPYYVPSGSMEPTLQIGDELLATKYPYGYSAASLPPFITLPDTQRILAALPERGDIVVFRWSGDRSQIWVKRVVGLPGDRRHTIFKHLGVGAFDEMAEIVVPADRLFVMGDNRDNSADSRVAVEAGGVGLLPTTDLVGRVDALVGSWDLGVRHQPIWTWPAGLRLSRFFTTVQ